MFFGAREKVLHVMMMMMVRMMMIVAMPMMMIVGEMAMVLGIIWRIEGNDGEG